MPDTPLLLLHGALGAARQFDAIVPRLGARPVLALDLPGHGARAGDDGAFTMDRFVDEVLAALDRHGLARARLFGYSMGGYVALLLAARHPARVASVTTLGTKLAWTPEAAARESRFLDPGAIAAKGPRFAEALAGRHGTERWGEVCRRTAALLAALGERPPLDDALYAALAVPVRLAVGDRDATVTLEETIGAYRAIPGAELAVLPGTEHAWEKVEDERVVALMG